LNVGVSTSKQSTHRKYYTGTGAPIGSVYDWNGNYPYPAAWNLGTNYDWREISKTISGFASGRFSITDGLHVILGGRYNDWKGDVRHFQEFTPYAGVTFDVNKNHTVYASYAEQFNPQDFMDVTGNYLDPKVGKSYEAGIKGEYFDGALNGALSVYKTMQDNVAEIITPNVLIPGTSQRAYRSVSGISTTGVELDVSGQLAPGWQLGLGIGLSQTKDRLGKDFLGYLPDNTVKLYTSYRLPDAWNKFTIGGGMRWQDGTYYPFTNSGVPARFEQGSLALFDMMARYEFNKTFSAQLNITNLFDRAYFGMASAQVQYGEPRNVTLSLSARF
jgi:outer membrane receptor for ferric coprogen and ferric-rhodotorulic acid